MFLVTPRPPAILTEPVDGLFDSVASENVDIPATFKLSNSVCPSTSKSPLASIVPVNVETPVTFKSPLISPFPFTSNSVTVAIPVLMLGTSNSPNNLPFNTKSPLIV